MKKYVQSSFAIFFLRRLYYYLYEVFFVKIALIVLIIIIVAVLASGFVFEILLVKRGKPMPTDKEGEGSPLLEPTGKELLAYNATKLDKFNALPKEEIYITANDGIKLKGLLYRGTEDVTVICCHGYKAAPEMDYVAISEMYVEKGYSLLFPVMRGHGDSGGRYIGFGVLDAHDVKRWVEKAEDIFPGNDIFLHGMSMGATSVLNSADLFSYGEVSGIIADCGFTCPHDVFCHLIGEVYHIPRFPFVGSFELANMMLAKYDFHTYDVRYSIAESTVPCVYICGTADRFIPLDMARSIAACCVDSMFVEGGGHAASYMLETERYREFALSFIERHRRK